MNAVQKEKSEFVAKELFALIKRLDPEVKSVEYVVTEANEELVIITSDYYGDTFCNVTCDSLLAISRDVLKNF